MIILANSLHIPLKDKKVHCVIISPPYWNLRDYSVNGQLGLEKTPEEYVQNMVKVFREVWRVLRDDGTLWLNMGDSFSSGDRSTYRSGVSDNKGHLIQNGMPRPKMPNGLKPKDLCGIPWRLAFALQADGWYLRSDIIWSKANPMPESVTDRPTKAHEYIFLLTKSPYYFFDQEAVREPGSMESEARYNRGRSDSHKWVDGGPGNQSIAKSFEHMRRSDKQRGHSRRHAGFNDRWDLMEKLGQCSRGRNLRSVWNIATHPFSGAHFATFPEELVRRCLLAGTSEKGVCPGCGGPWVRIVDRIKAAPRAVVSTHASVPGQKPHGSYTHERYDSQAEIKTLSWKPSCKCGEERTVKAIVLDPFFGSGTVGVVAQKYNRRFIGLELKPEYCQMAQKRLNSQPVAMF